MSNRNSKKSIETSSQLSNNTMIKKMKEIMVLLSIQLKNMKNLHDNKKAIKYGIKKAVKLV